MMAIKIDVHLPKASHPIILTDEGISMRQSDEHS
jgi:hypothetical protein